MTHVPGWWEFVLLALAAYRLWRLAAWDTVTETWRLKAVRFGTDEYRGPFAKFLQCPWCLGFWITVVVWLAWLRYPHASVVAATPFALSTVVGTLGRLDDG